MSKELRELRNSLKNSLDKVNVRLAKMKKKSDYEITEYTGKTLTKDIEYDLSDDLPFIVNGTSLEDVSFSEGVKLLKQISVKIKNNTLVIPKGLKLTRVWQTGGATNYLFSNGLEVQLNMEDEEDEYFK